MAILNIGLGDWLGGECMKPVFVEKWACVNTLTLLHQRDGLFVAAFLIAGLFVPLIWVKEGHGFAGRLYLGISGDAS